MPLYEYECKPCDRVVELLVRSASDDIQCPQCGNRELDKVFSVPAAPAVNGRNGVSLPIGSGGEDCGAPRCCGGGCQL